MKKQKLIILLLIGFPFISIAQSLEWFPTGAKWYYDEGEFIKHYSSLEIAKDTVIHGQNTKSMVKKKYDKLQNSLITLDTFYVYEKEQKVYAYNYKVDHIDSTDLCLIYDFSLSKGDSFVNECAHLTIYIDSVYQTNINGHSLKTYDYFAPGMVADFTGTVYEFIGHEFYFFPDQHLGLRCYDGPAIGHYNSGLEENCDTVYVSVGITEQQQQSLEIYPNPAEDVAYIKWPDHDLGEMELRITDISGSLHRQKTQMSGQQARIGLSRLPAGIYLVSLMDGSGEVLGTTRLVKE
jgi:hypothetical protein